MLKDTGYASSPRFEDKQTPIAKLWPFYCSVHPQRHIKYVLELNCCGIRGQKQRILPLTIDQFIML